MSKYLMGFGATCASLVGLRLGGVIDWSWWAVLAPLWVVGLLATVTLLALCGVMIWADGLPRDER